jgi:uncharacterized membrane protein
MSTIVEPGLAAAAAPGTATPRRPGDWRAALALAAGEGAGAAFLVQELVGRWLGPFVSLNRLDVPGRTRLIVSAVVAAAAAAAALAAFARRRGWAPALRVARLASPLLVLWAAVALMNRTAYQERELDLLLVAALLVVGGERCAGVALRGLPGLARPRIARARAVVAPAVLAGVLAVGFTIATSVLGIRIHQKLLTSLYDLGMFENFFFNTLWGDAGRAANFPYFAQHAELLVYALAPAYWLAPRPETLLVLQSAALGGSVVPLYLLGRRWLRSPWQALVLAAAFVLYPAVHGPGLYEFHFLTISVFFVSWAAYFLATRRYRLLAVAVLGALACREDVALGLALVGLALGWMGWRRRASLAVGLAALLWFVVVKFWWMPRFGAQTFADHYGSLMPAGERHFGGIARTLITNPLYAFGTLLTREKLVLALHLLVPLAFLPLRQRRTWALLLPGLVVVGLTTSRPPVLQISFQYVCHFVPYLFVAAAAALAVRPRAVRLPALAALALGTAVTTAQFGMLGAERFHTGFQVVDFRLSDQERGALADITALAAMIPREASVTAGEHEGAHVARHRILMSLRDGIQRADYLALGGEGLRSLGREQVIAALVSGEYGVVARRGNHLLLGRGKPTTKNAEIVAWLRGL